MKKVILYFDGACRHNPVGPAGCGFQLVAMNRYGAKGQLIADGYKYLGYGRTNNEAEYEALIMGLEYIYQYLQVEKLYIRGDSDIVLGQMKGEYAVRSARLHPMYADANALLLEIGIPSTTFQFIPRSQNQKADNLANQAIATKRTSVHHYSTN